MTYLLGIDGGGTQTTAWISDQNLRVAARVQSGPSNPVKVGFKAAQTELAKAYRKALREARIPPAALDAVCAGLAGGDNPEVKIKMLRWMRKSIPARAHHITTDAEVTLVAAMGNSEGIIVIAGTGSIAFGRDRNGGVIRVGGWGNQFDDDGSGYDIGRRAIAAALRAHDGRGTPTSLSHAICRELRLDKITELVPLQLTVQQISALFPLVQQQAVAGDAIARELCRDAADYLAELANTIISRLHRRRADIPVVCSGGVFRSSEIIRRAFTRRVHKYAVRARVSLLDREPVEGALLLARQLPTAQTRTQVLR